MTTDMAIFGRSAFDICEAEAGSRLHRAIVLSDLASAACGAAEEFGYEETDLGNEIATKCREIEALVERLSLDDEGRLTLYRECLRCGGNPKVQVGCSECGGDGYVHADEAE